MRLKGIRASTGRRELEDQHTILALFSFSSPFLSRYHQSASPECSIKPCKCHDSNLREVASVIKKLSVCSRAQFF
jgi:hypothetical protein